MHDLEKDNERGQRSYSLKDVEVANLSHKNLSLGSSARDIALQAIVADPPPSQMNACKRKI